MPTKKVRARRQPRRERASALNNALIICKKDGFNRGVAFVMRDRRLVTGVTNGEEHTGTPSVASEISA